MTEEAPAVVRSDSYPALSAEPYDSVADVNGCNGLATSVVPAANRRASQDEKDAREFAFQQDMALCSCMAVANVLEGDLKTTAVAGCTCAAGISECHAAALMTGAAVIAVTALLQ